MSSYWMWWIVGAALVATELVTGTFYLLVIGLALVCGGIAAWFGADIPLQWLITAVLAVAGTVLLHRWKLGQAAVTPQKSLDVGAQVQVQNWSPNGTARVAYRGSTWDAEVAAPGTPRADTMYIAGMRGSVLLLSDRRPEGA